MDQWWMVNRWFIAFSRPVLRIMTLGPAHPVDTAAAQTQPTCEAMWWFQRRRNLGWWFPSPRPVSGKGSSMGSYVLRALLGNGHWKGSTFRPTPFLGCFRRPFSCLHGAKAVLHSFGQMLNVAGSCKWTSHMLWAVSDHGHDICWSHCVFF